MCVLMLVANQLKHSHMWPRACLLKTYLLSVSITARFNGSVITP